MLGIIADTFTQRSQFLAWQLKWKDKQRRWDTLTLIHMFFCGVFICGVSWLRQTLPNIWTRLNRDAVYVNPPAPFFPLFVSFCFLCACHWHLFCHVYEVIFIFRHSFKRPAVCVTTIIFFNTLTSNASVCFRCFCFIFFCSPLSIPISTW